MSKGFRQSQSTLHTWSGLLLGWVMFIIFVTGTMAFWREGLNRWMQPDLPRVERPLEALAGAQRFLEANGGKSPYWYITMPSEKSPGVQVYWEPSAEDAARGRRFGKALIDADGRADRARGTLGGEFFYRFHFDLHYLPVIYARYLVSLAAMFMLVAILTGIVTHKKIFKDFFTLRRRKGQRSWLDGHNAVAVLALPFHLMITYTGLVTLATMLVPWAITANYQDEQKYYDAVFPNAGFVEPAGKPAKMASLSDMVRDAERRLGASVTYLSVNSPGDASARVTVSRSPSSMLSSYTPSLTYDGVTGKLVWQSPSPSAGMETTGGMIGLHAGRYAGYDLRFLYFLCGVAGCVMVASGLVLWTVKRRGKLPDPERPHFGFRLVERMNIGVVAGFPLGVAAMLWANRLLPIHLAERAEWEVRALFLAWAASFAAAILVRPRLCWIWLPALTGVLLALLPFYNLLATPQGLFAALGKGDLAIAGIDLGLLVFGAGFLAIARRVAGSRGEASRPPRRTARNAAHEIAVEPAE